MKPTSVSTTDLTAHDASVTYLIFDVTDSSALSTLVITAWKYDISSDVRHEMVAHIAYASNPEVDYFYKFDGAMACADLYLALMGEDSAGKVATYIRNNADEVSKHVDGKVEFLPPRKSMKETV